MNEDNETQEEMVESAPVVAPVAIKVVVDLTKDPIKALPFPKKYLDDVSNTYTQHKNRTPASKLPGTDVAMPVGTPIYAATAGLIVEADKVDNSASGKWVKVRGAKGVETYYLHLSKVLAKKGQRVAAGSLIGYSGSTGASTGPHLHFSLRIGGKLVDPAKYIKGLK